MATYFIDAEETKMQRRDDNGFFAATSPETFLAQWNLGLKVNMWLFRRKVAGDLETCVSGVPSVNFWHPVSGGEPWPAGRSCPCFSRALGAVGLADVVPVSLATCFPGSVSVAAACCCHALPWSPVPQLLLSGPSHAQWAGSPPCYPKQLWIP